MNQVEQFLLGSSSGTRKVEMAFLMAPKYAELFLVFFVDLGI